MTDEGGLDYASAGVDIERSDAVKRRIRAVVESTFTAGARGAFGGFGGMFRIPAEAQRPVLVSSADGVGTKLRRRDRGEPPRHGRTRPREPLRQRHPRAGRAAALLPRLLRRRTPGARRRRSGRDGGRRGMPRERMLARRRRDGGDAGDLHAARLRSRGLHRRDVWKRTPSSAPIAWRRATCSIGLASNGLHTNGYSLARRIVTERMKLRVGGSRPPGRGRYGRRRAAARAPLVSFGAQAGAWRAFTAWRTSRAADCRAT